MKLTRSEVQEKIKTLLATNDTLLAKGDALTQEDALSIQANQAELGDLDTALKAFQSADAAVAGAAELRSRLSLPVPGFSQPGADPKAAKLLGFQPAGETELDGNGFEVKSIGPGHISPEILKAIGASEYKDAWNKYVRKGFGALTNLEQKALQEGIDEDGGYLVPTDMINRIIAKKPTPTRVASLVDSVNTARDSITLPKVNYATDDLYSTGMRVTWTGEVPASSTTHRATQPLFGQAKIPVYTAMLSIPLTKDLLEDTGVDLEAWISAKFMETIELLYDSMILGGTGVNQPSGILANPGGTDQPATVATGDASTITADGVTDLIFALPEQYDGDSTVALFNKTSTGKALAKLKDGDGRYLWGFGRQDDGLAPSIKGRQILGYPTLWSGFMPDIAANAYPIIFGDFKGYMLVRRIGLSIQILRELLAETNQVLVLGRVRFGGQVLEPWRLKVQKVASS